MKNQNQADVRRVIRRNVPRGLMIAVLSSTPMWNLYAHGNRSSHDGIKVSWAPDDYVLFRARSDTPNDPRLQEIDGIQSNIDIIRKGLTNVPVDNARLESALENPSLNISTSDGRAEAIRKIGLLLQKKRDLLAELRLGTTTKQVLALLASGETDKAKAVIEGEGNVSKITDTYQTTLLDLYNASYQNGQSTTENSDKLKVIGQFALDFAQKNATASNLQPAVMLQLAELTNNISNFLLPDTGTPVPGIYKISLDAGELALRLRTQLSDKSGIMWAHWQLGIAFLYSGNKKSAAEQFEEQLKLAQELNDQEGIAWASSYLAKTVAPSDPTRAHQLEKKVKPILNQLKQDGIDVSGIDNSPQ